MKLHHDPLYTFAFGVFQLSLGGCQPRFLISLLETVMERRTNR